jgi:hypothetical protein
VFIGGEDHGCGVNLLHFHEEFLEQCFDGEGSGVSGWMVDVDADGLLGNHHGVIVSWEGEGVHRGDGRAIGLHHQGDRVTSGATMVENVQHADRRCCYRGISIR